MGRTLKELIAKYRHKGVVVDANLLLVFLIGSYSPALLRTYPRIKGHYSPDDFEILAMFLVQFPKKLTTPHILTEVSNLAGKLPWNSRTVFFEVFTRFVALAEEEFLPSRDLLDPPSLPLFGLTDLSIAQLANEKYLVLTDDLRVSAYMMARGVDVLNFHTIRFMDW